VEFERDAGSLRVRDPNSALQVSVQVGPQITEAAAKQEPTNAPGRPDRPNGRAPAVEREARVRPRRLGHVVIGSLDQEASQRFFTQGLGFKVSDHVPGLASFMRCSTDHHNLLVQQAPVNFLHHTAWEVDDVDEVGRGATAMLEGHPERHVWGLGRHHIGSNFFWYLKDPVGNFSEYYSDLDIILDDQLWKPSVVEGARGLYNWGPPPPPSFIQPEDLAALMTGSHAPKA
jgi:catechol 2,3-dioxygenase-like lactoylglutathione lyase family enzyme